MDTEYLAWERRHRAHERHVAAALVALLIVVAALAAPIVGSAQPARAATVGGVVPQALVR